MLACLAAAAAQADVWGVKTMAPFSGPPSTLFRIAAGSFVPVGEMTLGGSPDDVDGLALRPDGTLFGFLVTTTAAQSRLVTVDKTTAAMTPVGPPLAERDIRGAAFTAGGTLLALDAAANAVLELDDATGAIVGAPVGLTLAGAPFDLSNITDLAEVAGGGLVLVSIDRFFALDASTGVLTALHHDAATAPDGFGVAHAGLCWGADIDGAPRLGTYEVNADEDIFTYDPFASYARALVFGGILPAYNAGRGDLASLPAGVVSVRDAAAPYPRLSLDAYPNPAHGGRTVRFVLPAEADVEVSVFAVSGARVRRIAAGRLGPGPHDLRWDGRDEAGEVPAAGLYFIRLRAGASSGWTRVTLLR